MKQLLQDLKNNEILIEKKLRSERVWIWKINKSLNMSISIMDRKF